MSVKNTNMIVIFGENTIDLFKKGFFSNKNDPKI